jgi:hypothetical protein
VSVPTAAILTDCQRSPASRSVLRDNDGVSAFVGRREPLARLTSALQALTVPLAGTTARWPGLVLITGEAGIGKTALLDRFATEAAAQGAAVAWGSCWDGEQAPAWWPWTQALRGLLEQSPDLRTAARPELAAVCGPRPARPVAADQGLTDSPSARRAGLGDRELR